jgi:hypothetical protein
MHGVPFKSPFGSKPRHGDCSGVCGVHGAVMAAAKFHVEVRGDVAVLVQEGAPLFEETSKSLAAVIATALQIGSKKIVVDARLSDLANYYNFVVRHAELIPLLGFDSTFRSAIVGLPGQVYVMDFIVSVGQNRGWNVRRFFDIDEALEWLASS